MFSQYAGLNQRRPISSEGLLDLIRNSGEYDRFRAEISRKPVEDEEDANLIIDLKELIDPIERMRNSVAHNRRPSNKIRTSYPGALERMNEQLDEYLIKWEI